MFGWAASISARLLRCTSNMVVLSSLVPTAPAPTNIMIQGPIVRINPREVHFNDPDFIDPLFPGPGRKTDKYVFTGRRTGSMGVPVYKYKQTRTYIFPKLAQNSIVATVDHDLHRKRRNTINNFFSSASIRRLEPIMKESMGRLLSRMEAAGKTAEVLPMHYVLKACTSDVITKYAFGDSFHFLEQEDYAMPYMEATDVYHLFNHAFCHFPWIGTLIARVPTWAIRMFIPGLTDMWSKQMVSLSSF